MTSLLRTSLMISIVFSGIILFASDKTQIITTLRVWDRPISSTDSKVNGTVQALNQKKSSRKEKFYTNNEKEYLDFFNKSLCFQKVVAEANALSTSEFRHNIAHINANAVINPKGVEGIYIAFTSGSGRFFHTINFPVNKDLNCAVSKEDIQDNISNFLSGISEFEADDTEDRAETSNP